MEGYLQLLIYSGYKFPFKKAVAVTLQALTRYKYMLNRARLLEDSPKYMSLYREAWYMSKKRKLAMYVEGMVFFKEADMKDKYRNNWKKHYQSILTT